MNMMEDNGYMKPVNPDDPVPTAKTLAEDIAEAELNDLLGIVDYCKQDSALPFTGFSHINLDKYTVKATGKTIRAFRMTRGNYNNYRGFGTVSMGDIEDQGYLIEMSDGSTINDSRHDGYILWQPAATFDRMTIKSPPPVETIDANILDDMFERIEERANYAHAQINPPPAVDLNAARGLRKHWNPNATAGTAVSTVDRVIDAVDYHVFPGTCMTVCCITLINGYCVTGQSSCVDPNDFNEVIGKTYAYKDAVAKIGQLEGYLLKQRMFEETS